MTQGKKTVSDKEIIEFFLEQDDPAFAVVEMQEEFEIGSEGLRKRLNQLVEEGRLASKKPGHRTKVYWVLSETVSA